MAYSLGTVNGSQSGTGVATHDAPNFTPAAGSAIVAFVWYYDTGTETCSMSDSAGSNDTWAEVGTKVNNAANQHLRKFVLLNAAASSTTPRATFTGDVNYITIVYAEVAGVATSDAVVGSAAQAQTNPGTGTDAVSSGNTGTLTSQPAAVIGFLFEDASPYTAPAAGTGYTSPGTYISGQARIVHKRVTATTAVAATGTDSDGASCTYTSAVVVLAEAGATQSNAPRAVHQMKLMGAM